MRYDFDYKIVFEGKSEIETILKLVIYIYLSEMLEKDLMEKYKLN
jgi:hypothetical protein